MVMRFKSPQVYKRDPVLEMSGISGISIQIRIGKRLSDITIVEVVWSLRRPLGSAVYFIKSYNTYNIVDIKTFYAESSM